MDEEYYEFTNGWSMRRDDIVPHNWILRDDAGRMVDRDKYRHDIMPRYGLTIAVHNDPYAIKVAL